MRESHTLSSKHIPTCEHTESLSSTWNSVLWVYNACVYVCVHCVCICVCVDVCVCICMCVHMCVCLVTVPSLIFNWSEALLGKVIAFFSDLLVFLLFKCLWYWFSSISLLYCLSQEKKLQYLQHFYSSCLEGLQGSTFNVLYNGWYYKLLYLRFQN